MAEAGISEKQANSNETKAFLTILLNEPWTENQKTLILEKVTSDLKTWIQESSQVDLEQELNTFLSQNVEQDSNNCATYTTDKFELNILFNPSSAILSASIAKLKSAHYAHFIYSGAVLQGSGDWPLKEETYTSGKFSAEINALDNKDLELVLCAFNQGKWTQNGLSKQGLSKLKRLVVNPDGGSVETSPLIEKFASYVNPILIFQDITKTLEASNIHGNIRFNRPTMYIFPAGEGDSAFFGISGFTFMTNGGYSRQSCFWPFVKHLDRIDAMLITHLNSDNIFGMKSMLDRKLKEKIYPDIGTAFFNSPTVKTSYTSQKDSLYVNLADVASEITDNLGELNVNRLNCLAPKDVTKPLNLYQKLGYGSLDLYILNPQQDSKEIKDFLSQWSKRVDSFSQQKSSIKPKGKEGAISLAHLVSVSVILVWRPACPKDNIVRILFPGNCPQYKLTEALDKLKNLDIFKKLSCTEESLSFKKPATPPQPKMTTARNDKKTTTLTKPEVKRTTQPKETKPDIKKPISSIRDTKPREKPASSTSSRKPPLSTSKSVDTRPTSSTTRPVVKKQQTVTSATTVSATPKRTVEKTTRIEPNKKPIAGKSTLKPKEKPKKKETEKNVKATSAKNSPAKTSVSNDTKEISESLLPSEQPPLLMNGDPANWVKQEPDASLKIESEVATQEIGGTNTIETNITEINTQKPDTSATEEETLPPSEIKSTTENGVENASVVPSDGSGDPGSKDNPESEAAINDGNNKNEVKEEATDLKTNSIEKVDEAICQDDTKMAESISDENGVTGNETNDSKQETVGEAVDVKELPTEMTASLIGSLDANDNKNEKPTQLDTSLPEGVEPPMSLPPPPPPKTTGRMSIGGRPLAKSATIGDTSSRSNSSRMSLPPRTNGVPLLDTRRAAPGFCVDLAYIPCHGDPHHVDSAFFSKIKAKHYVLSSQSPSRYILDAFLDGLTEGEDQVQLIPTYESPVLRNWMTVREEDLETKHVKVAPSASRCSIQLQDNEIGCPAFRLEF